MRRRWPIAAALLSTLLVCPTHAADAQNYPVKPIRFIIPGAPGNTTDFVGRTVARKLSEAWGQPVVPDNRAGAGGIIGVETAARSAHDGYVITIVVTSFSIDPSVYAKLPYDPFRDFAPVILLGSTQNLISVPPTLAVNSVKDLIALAKSKPGQFNYGTGGRGTGVHLATELFKQMAGIDIVHVEYKSSVLATNDLMAGRLLMVINNVTTTVPLIKGGKLKALAVTGDRRSPLMPELPTVAESALPGYSYKGWFGILAPAHTPKEIVAKLNHEIARQMKMPDVQQLFAAVGFDSATSTPEEFARYLKEQVATWARVTKQAGLKPE